MMPDSPVSSAYVWSDGSSLWQCSSELLTLRLSTGSSFMPKNTSSSEVRMASLGGEIALDPGVGRERGCGALPDRPKLLPDDGGDECGAARWLCPLVTLLLGESRWAEQTDAILPYMGSA